MLSMKVGSMQFNKRLCRIVIIPRNKWRCANKQPTTMYDNIAFFRTNVIADYIDKFTNDINMVALSESNDPEFQCKYVAHFNAILIIALILFMYFDNSDKKS